MPIKILQTWRTISHFREPYRCMARCVVYGFFIGIVFLIIGIPLLVFFGSNLKEDEAIKKVPAWIGVIVACTGMMAVIMGIALCALIFRLVAQQESVHNRLHAEAGGAALLNPSALNGSRPFPVDSVYAPTVYNIDTSAPLFDHEEKADDHHRQAI